MVNLVHIILLGPDAPSIRGRRGKITAWHVGVTRSLLRA